MTPLWLCLLSMAAGFVCALLVAWSRGVVLGYRAVVAVREREMDREMEEARASFEAEQAASQQLREKIEREAAEQQAYFASLRAQLEAAPDDAGREGD